MMFRVCTLLALVGCTPQEHLTVENAAAVAQYAAAVAQYDTALVECKRAAKGSYDAYVACEDAVTRHYCRESRALQKEWPRCKELTP